MKPAHQAFFVAVLAFVLFGLQSASGLTLAAIIGTLLVAASLIALRYVDPTGRLRLGEIFLLAVTLRWIISAIAFLVISEKNPGFIAPDEIFYDSTAFYFAEYLAGHVPNPYPDNFPGGVIWTSGVIYYLFGFVPMVPRFLNGIIGAWGAVLAGLIGWRLLDEAVGRRAAFLAAVTPSLIVWATVNTKDASTLLGGEVALFAFLLLRDRFSVRSLALFAGGLLFVAAHRPYEIVFIGVAAVAGFAFTQQGNTARNILVGVALTAVVAVLVRVTGATEISTQQGELGTMDTIAMLREGYASGAGSAVNTKLVDTSTPTGLMLWAPIGLFYFYFAPIPFTGTSLASMATSPEMICLYLLMPAVIRGARQTLRDRFRATMPLLVYLFASSVGWSLVITNVGSLYRYRSQVLFVLLIFMAADMVRKKRASLAAAAVDPFIESVLRARALRDARLARPALVASAPQQASPDQPGPRPLPSPSPAGR